MESPLRDGDRPGLRLIETFGWDGAFAPRLPLHMDRMQAAASGLGWRFDRAAIDALLRGAQIPGQAARIRLTLAAQGAGAVTTAPMPKATASWRIGLAAVRLRSDDRWLRVKSNQRAGYDAARAAMAPGLDEVVLQNESGEVCDGSIATLFFDRGDGMRTPPLKCGVLPGVLRAEMALPEQVLLARDLPKVRLWMGNSLRGLIPAVWVG